MIKKLFLALALSVSVLADPVVMVQNLNTQALEAYTNMGMPLAPGMTAQIQVIISDTSAPIAYMVTARFIDQQGNAHVLSQVVASSATINNSAAALTLCIFPVDATHPLITVEPLVTSGVSITQ